MFERQTFSIEPRIMAVVCIMQKLVEIFLAYKKTLKNQFIHRSLSFYIMIKMSWVCILYRSVYYQRDFMVSTCNNTFDC